MSRKTLRDYAAMQTPDRLQVPRNVPTPWSPVGVCIIAFILPPGGAVLTIWNLQRLGQLNATTARQLMLVVMSLFALGYALLLSLTPVKSGSVPQFDASAARLINFGTAIASYLVQRPRFIEWRVSHKRDRSGSVASAVGIAVVYSVIWLVPTTITYLIVQALVGGTGAGL